MKRYLFVLICSVVLSGCSGGGSSTGSTTPTPLTVNVTGSFATISAGGAPVTLTASVSGDPSSKGVKWTLSVANTGCSPACGTLVPVAASPTVSAVYTPPASPPGNSEATITASSIANDREVFVFNFQILLPISVSITNKFTTQTAGGPVVNLAATITNDVNNAGLSWTLTAGGTSCAPTCGTLTTDPAPALTAHYTPPAVPPSGANASPTITAASVVDSTKSDNFSFTIVAPPISVTITSKFSSQSVGGSSVTVAAVAANDFTNAGLSWTLTAAGAACAPACGTLVPGTAPSLSAAYTPPTVLPTGAAASPMITATSVADLTKSDSFSFTIVAPASLFMGKYALLLRGYDAAGAPMAIAGSISSNGFGVINDGELEINDNGNVIGVAPPLAGSYTIDTSFNGIPRVTISINLPSNTVVVLKCTLSSDGKRGKVIQFDGTFALNAGTLLQQDPTALTAANPSGSYAFGIDSDAGTNGAVIGRIVEAGHFVLGAGGTSVTGGIADASQAFASGPVFGGAVSGAAPLDVASSSATAPDSSGRGTLTLSFASNVTKYAYYMVNAQQLNLLEIDTGGAFKTVQAGTAQLQKTLTANSILATSVVALTGETLSAGVPASDVMIGQLAIAATSALPSVAVTFDQNSGGSTHLNSNNIGAGGVVLSFDPVSGRAVLAHTFFLGAIVYLYDTGKGFLIDGTPSPNHAFSGPLMPQAAPPFSAQDDLSGNLITLGGGSASPSIPNFEMAANFDGTSSYSGQGDLVSSNTAIGANGQIPNFSLVGDNFSIVDTNLGHGEIFLLGGLFGDANAGSTDIAAFYIIGPNQFVAIGIGPTTSGGPPSGILFFDPQ